MRRLALQLLALMISTTTLASGPPTETLDRLDRAVSYLDGDQANGSYTFTSHSVIAKPNGKDRHVVITIEEVTKTPGREAARDLIRMERDGEDVTEEFAERQAKRAKKRERAKAKEDEEEENGGTVSLSLPSAEELASYRFGQAEPDGEVMVVDYRPQDPGNEEGGSGRLAWNPDTLDPAWIEFTPTRNPKFVKRLWLRLEFARSGDELFIHRTLTEGLGGMLFIKREFTVETEVTDITLDPSPSPPTGNNEQ